MEGVYNQSTTNIRRVYRRHCQEDHRHRFGHADGTVLYYLLADCRFPISDLDSSLSVGFHMGYRFDDSNSAVASWLREHCMITQCRFTCASLIFFDITGERDFAPSLVKRVGLLIPSGEFQTAKTEIRHERGAGA